MSLENQIKNVGMDLIELEEQLARDTIILDKLSAIQEHIQLLKVRALIHFFLYYCYLLKLMYRKVVMNELYADIRFSNDQVLNNG